MRFGGPQSSTGNPGSVYTNCETALVLKVKLDELCFFLESGCGLAANNPVERAAPAEKEAQQDRGAAQNPDQGEDAQDETGDFGALADVTLRVVPNDVGLVVNLVEEFVCRGGREAIR